MGLALVNGDASGDVTANVELTLFSAAGEKRATEPLTLGPRSHRARFLNEFFPGQTLEGGLDEDSFVDPEFSLVHGELEAGRLRLTLTVLQDPFSTGEATLSLGHDEFSFGAAAVSGDWIELFPDETVLKGTYVLTRRDDG